MNSNRTPFAGRPAKPQATRLPDGRIGIFIGSAYQFTTDEGARSLRDQLDELLQPTPPPDISRRLYEQADRAFSAQLAAELQQVEAGGCAPPILASKARA